MRRFDAALRRATPKGHKTFISCTAAHQESRLPRYDSSLRAWHTNAGVLRVHLGTAELLRNHAGGAHVTAEDAPWMAPDPVTTPSLKGCPAPWSSDASDAGRCRVPRKNPHRAGTQAAPWQVINVGARGQRVCHALPPAPSRTEPMRRGLLTAWRSDRKSTRLNS